MKKRIPALLAAVLAVCLLAGCANWDESVYTDDPLGELSH